MRVRICGLVLIMLLWLLPGSVLYAQSGEPALIAQALEAQLFNAQRRLDSDVAAARAGIGAARIAHDAQLAMRLPPVPAAAAEAAFDGLERAVATGDAAAFAAARADYHTALIWAAHDAALRAAHAGDAAQTMQWLRLRDYKPGSRLNPAAATATLAAQALLNGESEPAAAAAAIAADLDETYQALLEEALTATAAAAEQQFAQRVAQESALALGYFRILRTDFATKAARERAGRLQQFLALVPYEYTKGVRNGQVVIPFEIEEARTFLRQARLLVSELRASFTPEQLSQIGGALDAIDQGIAGVVDPGAIQAQADAAQAVVVAVFGEVETAGATFELIGQLLNQLKGAVRRGDYAQAETLRVEAYALFEVGPEPKLLGRDPVLATRIETLFWQGDAHQTGLATATAQQLTLVQVTPTFEALRADLDAAETLLSAEMSLPISILSSLAIIVREGLEAVLVLGAALAVLRRSQARRGEIVALFGGAGLALLLSLATWLLAQSLLQIGVVERELLEGVMGLLAVAVLIIVTNWLFHKAYVVDWLGYVRQQIARARQHRGLGTLGAMALLGFTVVYREGFETVLFYQALLFDAPPTGVLIGFVVGALLCLAVAYAVLTLALRLPLKPFFSATTVLLILLALMLVGSSARNLQEAGLLSVTPLTLVPAHPLAATFGLYPTIETVAAQLGLLLFLALTLALQRWRGPSKPTTKPAL